MKLNKHKKFRIFAVNHEVSAFTNSNWNKKHSSPGRVDCREETPDDQPKNRQKGTGSDIQKRALFKIFPVVKKKRRLHLGTPNVDNMIGFLKKRYRTRNGVHGVWNNIL